jgi:hypothetical protein
LAERLITVCGFGIGRFFGIAILGLLLLLSVVVASRFGVQSRANTKEFDRPLGVHLARLLDAAMKLSR